MYALCAFGAVNTQGFVWRFFMQYIYAHLFIQTDAAWSRTSALRRQRQGPNQQTRVMQLSFKEWHGQTDRTNRQSKQTGQTEQTDQQSSRRACTALCSPHTLIYASTCKTTPHSRLGAFWLRCLICIWIVFALPPPYARLFAGQKLNQDSD